MDPETITHAQLTAQLAVEGLLSIVEGKPRSGQVTVPGVPLTAEEKEKLQLKPGSLAIFYPVGETGVFMSMHDSHSRVWYNDVDTDGALETLERALQRAYPHATFTTQTDHPTPGMSVRLYRVEFGGPHFAAVEVTYPITRTVKQQFIVRVHAMEKR